MHGRNRLSIIKTLVHFVNNSPPHGAPWRQRVLDVGVPMCFPVGRALTALCHALQTPSLLLTLGSYTWANSGMGVSFAASLTLFKLRLKENNSLWELEHSIVFPRLRLHCSEMSCHHFPTCKAWRLSELRLEAVRGEWSNRDPLENERDTIIIIITFKAGHVPEGWPLPRLPGSGL